MNNWNGNIFATPLQCMNFVQILYLTIMHHSLLDCITFIRILFFIRRMIFLELFQKSFKLIHVLLLRSMLLHTFLIFFCSDWDIKLFLHHFDSTLQLPYALIIFFYYCSYYFQYKELYYHLSQSEILEVSEDYGCHDYGGRGEMIGRGVGVGDYFSQEVIPWFCSDFFASSRCFLCLVMLFVYICL